MTNRRTFLKAVAQGGAVWLAGCATTTGRAGSPKNMRAFSPAGIDDLHRVMAGYVERGEVPGMVTLLARRGDVRIDAIGALAVGSKSPMQHDTIFRISSMTKPVT